MSLIYTVKLSCYPWSLVLNPKQSKSVLWQHLPYVQATVGNASFAYIYFNYSLQCVCAHICIHMT